MTRQLREEVEAPIQHRGSHDLKTAPEHLKEDGFAEADLRVPGLRSETWGTDNWAY